ncbi:MAG: YbaK/EbsC family protein [Clostridiales Family XIII bacterium]|jgi:prolyl-tRNA editing enzyme YbaK/EbsC (Cys-tRNA(Pro) deacylase)|nr:YbaK/EbsC family protein [Clostridiales Family XIII bacterium]
MSLESVRDYLKKWGIEDRILEFPTSSATVEEAARAIGCREKEIAKTMSFKIGDAAMLIVMAGDAKIDNSKYKARYSTKAKMLKGEEVEQITGHPAGGVCPFGISEDVAIYLDKSLKRFEKVYPACGSKNSAIELSLNELEKCSNYKEWIDVCKGWE